MNHTFANGMKMWKGNGNTTTLIFFLERLEISHQETKGQVKTIVMEHLKVQKSGPANKQQTNLPTTNKTRKAWDIDLTEPQIYTHVLYSYFIILKP